MKCNNCGTEYNEGVFCPECGMKNIQTTLENNNETISNEGLVKKENSHIAVEWQNAEWDNAKSDYAEKEKKYQLAQQKKMDNEGKGLGIASVILGVISIISCGTFAITEIIGLILGLCGRKQGSLRISSIIGIVLNSLSLIQGILVVIILFSAPPINDYVDKANESVDITSSVNYIDNDEVSLEETDLYELVGYTEQQFVEEYGYEKNIGLYPTEENAILWFDEDGLFSISVVEAKYHFLNVCVGDNIDSLSDDFLDKYPEYEVERESIVEGIIDRYYKGEKDDVVMVSYYSESRKIQSIKWTCVGADSLVNVDTKEDVNDNASVYDVSYDFVGRWESTYNVLGYADVSINDDNSYIITVHLPEGTEAYYWECNLIGEYDAKRNLIKYKGYSYEYDESVICNDPNSEFFGMGDPYIEGEMLEGTISITQDGRLYFDDLCIDFVMRNSNTLGNIDVSFLCGNWQDTYSERAYMEIKDSGNGDGTVEISVSWADGANSWMQWNLVGSYNPDKMSIEYTGYSSYLEYEMDSNFPTETVINNNLKGNFWLDGIYLDWMDDVDSSVNQCCFEKVS